jgi:two-component system, LuxR family, sensor kinase FixL
LQETEQRFRAMADAAPVMIWMAGADKLCTYFNRGWLAFTGRTTDQEMGNGWTEGVHREDLDRCVRIYSEAFGARRKFTMEYRLRRHDGEYRWVLDSGAPRVETDGTFLGYIGSAFDVTDIKRAEAETALRRNELAHLSRVAMLGELSGSLAHELNQPLAAILSNAQAAQRILARGAGNLDEIREILKDIVEDDKRAGEVIKRLRALFRKEELRYRPLEINDVVLDVLRLMRSDLSNRDVTVSTELAAGLPRVEGDPIQLQQVLLNLVMNGCDAMDGAPGERRLTLRTAAADGEVEVSVADRGPGIPPADLQRIFDPFVSTKSDGMGLGLAVCRTIVDAHAGRLWAANNGDRGASFHFTLPAKRENTDEWPGADRLPG